MSDGPITLDLEAFRQAHIERLCQCKYKKHEIVLLNVQQPYPVITAVAAASLLVYEYGTSGL